MNYEPKHNGFSLTEVLMAVVILTLAMLMIAITFPLGISLTTAASERSIAAVAADEAFAKIRLFDVNTADDDWPVSTSECVDFREISRYEIDPDEFRYPSVLPLESMYYWSAIFRAVDWKEGLFQVTVFVSRKRGAGLKYPGGTDPDWPWPIKVTVTKVNSTRLQISNSSEKSYINDDYTIVDDETGDIYRVIERDPDFDNEIILDRDWENPADSGVVWVIPPSTNGGKGPCIGVFQKVIRF